MKNYGLADQFISPWAVGTTGREVMDITLGLIGFGEAGSTFAVTAAWSGKSRGWDILPQRCAAMADAGVIAAVEAVGEAEIALRAAGFARTRIVGADVGRASAIKMIRSVMVKGIEALTAEMMLAARAAGVEDEVLASLDASEKARKPSAADRALLVPDLQGDVRVRRARDDPRFGQLQPRAPRHRQLSHRRRHDRVHAIYRGRSVRARPELALHHPARWRRGALDTRDRYATVLARRAGAGGAHRSLANLPVHAAVREDVGVPEAQQCSIAANPDLKIAAYRFDEGGVCARQAIDRAIQAQSPAHGADA